MSAPGSEEAGQSDRANQPDRTNQPDRDVLLHALNLYQARYPADEDTVARIRDLVAGRPDCFERTCMPGHITGSAWILSPDRSKYLLTRHRIFDRWLQLGGHADGCPRPHLVAMREAEEESGLSGFGLYRDPEGFVPLDVDIHAIAARPGVPAHEHYDLRYLLAAAAEQPLEISDESHDLRWFDKEELLDTVREDSVLRMLHKGDAVLKRGGGEFVYGLS
ncbi:MAG: NUDIX hydrolase [Gemmatimonadetes bacterium]|nr:NUDIX hydrolase [Gemmatimonadota bacterium]